MVTTTRTLNPLPFQDLEPHRFEDLIRQLAYDFKNWRRLEATGRAGSDDGFDARGLEIVVGDVLDAIENDEDGASDAASTDRLWLIQSKREKAIGPKKLGGYLDSIPLPTEGGIYGLVLAAPCIFSKDAYDVFLSKCREKGISEAVLWGRGELEDFLFQPKNDSLLFAYFGISLLHRRRSLRTEVRSRLATKKKLERLPRGQPVLIRDANELRYPFAAEIPDFRQSPRWVVWRYRGTSYRGGEFVVRRHFAAFSADSDRWDAALGHREDIGSELLGMWSVPVEQSINRETVSAFWSKLSDQQKAWLEVIGAISYDRIIAVDETGDDIAKMPHIYVEFLGKDIQDAGWAIVSGIQPFDQRELHPDDENDRRVAIFPGDMRIAPQPVGSA